MKIAQPLQALLTSHIPAQPAGALLALDIGDRRLGLAVCDPERRLVTPLPPLRRTAGGAELAALQSIVREREIQALVAGLPLLAGGQEGSQAQKTRQYLRRLERALGLPVHLVDERHSSVLAAQHLIERGRTGRRARQRHLDSEAAAVILEDFLAAQGAHGR